MRKTRTRLVLLALGLAPWAAVPAFPRAAFAADTAQGSDRDVSSARAKAGGEDSAALLERGIDLLTGPGSDREALAALLRAAELSDRPASAWLWAAVAAERLGMFAEAGAYKARALAPSPGAHPAPAAAAPPAPAPSSPAPALPVARAMAIPAPPPAPAPAAPAATAKPEVAAEPAAAEPETAAEPEAKKPEAKKEEKADAFQYFFGERPKPKPQQEDPPASPPVR